MIRFIDLFAGTGGIRLAFEKAMDNIGESYQCIKSVEIDKKACETYELNFGVNPYGDITKLKEIAPFDVLLAGFPCQAFSYAGKQLGFGETRGTLFFEIERIIKKYKPKLCLLENVRGLTTHDKGRTFKTILKSLERLGYNVSYRLLNSSNYGLPQNRVRVYILASLDPIKHISLPNDAGADNSHHFLEYSSTQDLFTNYEHSILESILEEKPNKKYDCSDEFTSNLKKVLGGDLKTIHGKRLIDTRHGNSIHSWDLGIKGKCTQREIDFMNLLISNRRKHIFGTHQDGKALTLNQIKSFYVNNDIEAVIESLLKKGYLKKVDGKFNPVCGNMSFEVFKFLDPKTISITLTASDSNRLGVYHKGRVRRITPRECARLQGYPENYKLHPSDNVAYKQFGNAVSVPVITKLLEDYFKHNPSSLLKKKRGGGKQKSTSPAKSKT